MVLLLVVGPSIVASGDGSSRVGRDHLV